MESRILDIKDKICGGQTSYIEQAQNYLQAIQDKNNQINAFCRTMEDCALLTAADADAAHKSGESLGLLAGIPMAVKDNIVIKGVQCNAGSKALEGYKPTYDASVIQTLKANNAVILGKTNMKEFAMGGYYASPVCNPIDSDYCTEDGAAAAVAAGIAVYALGSDSDGGIIRSAAQCGIVGLRPTYGSVSRNGLVAYVSGCDQIGVLAASVKDAAIVYDTIKGHDPKDQTSIKGTPSAPIHDKLDGCLAGKRIGIVEELWQDLDFETQKALQEAVGFYKDNGVQIVKLSLPILKYAAAANCIIACAEASSNLGKYDGIRYGYCVQKYNDVNDMITRTRTEGFGREVQKKVMLGTYFLSLGHYKTYFEKAQSIRARITEELNSALDGCDALVTPACKTSKTLVSSLALPWQDAYTLPAVLAGLPAVSVPCGKYSNGLPIGMQLIGKRLGEQAILSLGYSFCSSKLQ